ncbi:unnamed protein product [Ranitomeya imitator]|uniref:Uncharacterized protein n=1 Tax=Ranitomeya imitator TaxID=111125 RepID=A0ABN9MFM5_9NEOB|nr:unnamed protein product [Ranitomeya imitator]
MVSLLEGNKCGRKRCTTRRGDRTLRKIVEKDRFQTLGNLRKQWTESGVETSRATVHRRCAGNGLQVPHSPAEAVVRSIIVPIITVSLLALALLLIGCWKRAWLKRICLPDIPDPNSSKILSFDGTKVKDIPVHFNRHILLTTNREPQIVDIVRIQDNSHHKTYEELTESSDHQLHELDTKVEGSKTDEDFGENYLSSGNEKSLYSLMNEPSCKSQPFPYLQFCNQPTPAHRMICVTEGKDTDLRQTLPRCTVRHTPCKLRIQDRDFWRSQPFALIAPFMAVNQ